MVLLSTYPRSLPHKGPGRSPAVENAAVNGWEIRIFEEPSFAETLSLNFAVRLAFQLHGGQPRGGFVVALAGPPSLDVPRLLRVALPRGNGGI